LIIFSIALIKSSGSVDVAIPFSFKYLFAASMFLPPTNDVNIGFFLETKTFAVAKGFVMSWGVRRIIKKSKKFSFSKREIVLLYLSGKASPTRSIGLL